jgi:hypothetical protein
LQIYDICLICPNVLPKNYKKTEYSVLFAGGADDDGGRGQEV